MQRFTEIPEALFERKKSSGRLGALLAWSVVFADIGTSIYYVPGLLFRELGGTSPSPAAAFVLATGIAFIFLSLKYVDVAARYPGRRRRRVGRVRRVRAVHRLHRRHPDLRRLLPDRRDLVGQRVPVPGGGGARGWRA